MPAEYVERGRSAAASSSANASMEGTAARAAWRVSPMASAPKSAFSRPVALGTSTDPTVSRTGLATARACPEVTGVSPAITRMRVDFPAPLAPSTPTVSPS